MEQKKYEALRKKLLNHTKIDLIQRIANLQDMLDAKELDIRPAIDGCGENYHAPFRQCGYSFCPRCGIKL